MNLSRSNIIVFRISLAAAVTGILILAATPLEYPVVSGINDKLNHIFAFFVLALLADFSFPEKKFISSVFFPLMGYGMVIEIIQHFLPYRMSSLFDVAADALGIALYWISMPLVQKSMNAIFHKK
jgi:VanZ family protein